MEKKLRVYVRFNDGKKEVFDLTGCNELSHNGLVLLIQSEIGKRVRSLLHVVK